MNEDSNNYPQKYALYCRVSTDKQTNENQTIRLLQYAIDNNLKFDLFEECESTRKTRPVKQFLSKMQILSVCLSEYSGIKHYHIMN